MVTDGEEDNDNENPPVPRQEEIREETEEQEDNVSLNELCERVVCYKCRQCSFLTQDKDRFLSHVRQGHQEGEGARNTQGQSGGVGVDISKVKMNKREILGKEELPPSPSTPPTPDAFLEMSDEDHEDEESRDEVIIASSTVPTDEGEPLAVSAPPGGMEMDDVFLCAACDVAFSSRGLCFRHMHMVHGLEQFSPEFIAGVIVCRKGERSSVETDADKSKSSSEETSSQVRKMGRVASPKELLDKNNYSLPHKRLRFSKSSSYRCSICPQKYDSQEILKIHEGCHLNEGNYNRHKNRGETSKDEHSSKSSHTRQGVSSYPAARKCHSSDEEDEHLTTGCEKSSVVEGRVEDTSIDTNSKSYKFKCSICKKGDIRKSDMRGEETFPQGSVEQCIKLFTKWSTCAAHLWKEHNIDCELYSCSVCEKYKNYYISKVKLHEKLHKPESNYICTVCNRKFKQKHQLTTHEKFHKEKVTRLPPPEDARWYTPKECPVCKRILSDAKCLKKHISAVHNKLRPYSCNVCNHTTARKAELKLHVRQHTGEKPFKCRKCSFSTGDHNSLRNHNLRHEKKYLYSCPHCDYQSIQASVFKRHVVSSHPAQEVVFTCTLCSHKSVSEKVASVHQKDHQEGRVSSKSQEHTTGQDSCDGGDGSDSRINESHSDADSNTEYPDIGIRSFGRRRKGVGTTKIVPRPRPRWLQEDEVEVIDTGGVTIPASPQPGVTAGGSM